MKKEKLEKKMKKIERKYSKTPELCVLKRKRLLKQAASVQAALDKLK